MESRSRCADKLVGCSPCAEKLVGCACESALLRSGRARSAANLLVDRRQILGALFQPLDSSELGRIVLVSSAIL